MLHTIKVKNLNGTPVSSVVGVVRNIEIDTDESNEVVASDNLSEQYFTINLEIYCVGK